jgi:hypothetical protein
VGSHRGAVSHARIRFGISDRELRATLVALKVLPSDEAAAPGNTTLVDLSPVSAILSRLRDSLNLTRAASVLGLHPKQLVRLCEDFGFVQPFFTRPSHDLEPLRYFELRDLEEFMSKLTARCSRVGRTGAMFDIWEAGLKASRQPADIIAAIYACRIPTFSIGKVRTIKDILVDLDDVKSCTQDPSTDDLISAEDCARTLVINIIAMRKVLQAGFLTPEIGINPINRRWQLSARRADVAEFDRSYVSLNALRLRYGTSGSGIAHAVFHAGVRPAFPVHLSEVTIYRRTEIEKIGPWLRDKLRQDRARRRAATQR